MILETIRRFLARYRPCGGAAAPHGERQATIDELLAKQARIEREIAVLEAQARGVRARRAGQPHGAGVANGQ